MIELESGVRRYSRLTWRHQLRRRRLERVLGAIGADVYVDRDVEFLRHPDRVTLGRSVILKEGARLCPTNPAASIAIGDRTTIGYHTFIFASMSIAIGNDCLIAPFCYLVDSNHGFKRARLIREQTMRASPIVVEDDVWLGVGVTVLSGVRIARGCVIGAGTVVTENLPEYAIATGNPARIVGYRE